MPIKLSSRVLSDENTQKRVLFSASGREPNNKQVWTRYEPRVRVQDRTRTEPNSQIWNFYEPEPNPNCERNNTQTKDFVFCLFDILLNLLYFAIKLCFVHRTLCALALCTSIVSSVLYKYISHVKFEDFVLLSILNFIYIYIVRIYNNKLNFSWVKQ